MIHILLINLTPEAEWTAWRAAQRVWGGRVIIQSAPNVETAVAILRHTEPFEQSPCPTLILLATGAHGGWDPAMVQQLREALSPYNIPLVGLANTSQAIERLLARRAPLDAVMLSPVQPDALQELAESLNLNKRPLLSNTVAI